MYQEQQLHKGAAEQLQQAERNRAALDLQAEDIMERSTAENGSEVPTGGVATLATAPYRIAAPQKLQDPYYSDFLIGLITPEQRKLLVEYGHGRHMHIDATHGTNNAKVPVYPLNLSCYTLQLFTCTVPV